MGSYARTLVRHPHFHMHFSPAGASWWNQMELWFSALSDQRLCDGARFAASRVLSLP